MPRQPTVSRTCHSQRVECVVRLDAKQKSVTRTIYAPMGVAADKLDDYITRHLLSDGERVAYHKLPVTTVSTTYTMPLAIFRELAQTHGSITETR